MFLSGRKQGRRKKTFKLFENLDRKKPRWSVNLQSFHNLNLSYFIHPSHMYNINIYYVSKHWHFKHLNIVSWNFYVFPALQVSIKILILIICCYRTLITLCLHWTLPTWDEKFLAIPTLAKYLSRDFTIFGIFLLFPWIGLLYSRIDLFPRPITIRWTDAEFRSTGSLPLAATVSRESRGTLRNNAWLVSRVEFWVSALPLLLYFHNFKHDRYFM